MLKVDQNLAKRFEVNSLQNAVMISSSNVVGEITEKQRYFAARLN